MKQIGVIAERKYSIDFVESWKMSLLETLTDRPAVVIYPASLESHLAELPKNIQRIEVPDGETQKELTHFAKTLNQIAKLELPRSGVIVGIGGGATTDVVGFAASSYLRGIDWIAIPTSLAGMVDAAIGGKTGINLDAGKNLAGAFYSPMQVIVDERFLETLSERDLRAGMAEVAKCGFISDPSILDLIADDWRRHLSELIYKSVAVKAEVVSRDFRESFEREVLNYGHTLGHAIEKHSDYAMRHGESISIGLVYAAALSHRYSGLKESDFSRHKSILSLLQLPLTYAASAWPDLLSIMRSDKKKRKGLRFVTLAEIGKPTRLEDTNEEVLRDVYQEVVGR